MLHKHDHPIDEIRIRELRAQVQHSTRLGARLRRDEAMGQLIELRSGSQGLKPSAARDLEPDSGGMRQWNSEMWGDLISPDHWTINFNQYIDFRL